MDRHTCKLCFRRFPNGRALGGHMRSHVTSAAAGGTTKQPQSTAPPPAAHLLQQQSSSSSPSYSASPPRQGQVTATRAPAYGVGGNKGSLPTYSPGYVLRENPRKSYRMVDPEFSSTFTAPPAAGAGMDSYYCATTSSPFFGNGNSGGSIGNVGNSNTTIINNNNNNNNNSSSAVVQDGESETESSKAPAAPSSRFRRSKRRRRYEDRSEGEEGGADDDEGQGNLKPSQRKGLKLKRMRVSEPDQPASSVSDTTPDEDVALCLMMLSRDVWTPEEDEQEDVGDAEERGDEEYEDDGDEPLLPFDEEYLDVDAHGDPEEEEMVGSAAAGRLRMPKMQLQRLRKGGARARFQCGTCKKVFRSYQALGGHRASHKKAKTCSAAAAAAPLTSSYTAVKAAIADTPSVRRPTPRILVDEQNKDNNHADYRHGHSRCYQQQRHYSNNNNHRHIPHIQDERDEEEEDDPDWGEAEADADADEPHTPPDPRIHQCPFCSRVFSSGQALGGHKRSHLIGGAAYRIPYTAIRPNTVALTSNKTAPVTHKPSQAAAVASGSGHKLTVHGTPRLVDNFIDLNLPAPVDEGEEEDGSYVELSALSDLE